MNLHFGGIWALVLALALAVDASAQTRQVNVYNWSDYIAPEVLTRFTAETGVRVVYDVYDSNEILEAKLSAGRSGYDLVAPTASPFLDRQIKAGMHQPIDRARIPNAAGLDPEVMAKLARNDPGNRHAVPWMWGTTGIGHNVDRVKRIMADAPVFSLALIFDPEIVRRFQGCGVSLLDSPTDVIPATLLHLRLPPDSQDLSHLDRAVEHLRKVRPFIRKFHSSQYINDLANGNLCIAFGFSGDVFQAAARALEAKRPFEIAYAIPTEGALFWVDAFVIPRDARNVAEAHMLLDFLLRPANVAASTNLVGYANAVPASLAQVEDKVRRDPTVFPPAEIRARFYTISPANADYERALNRAWTRIKTGR
jgi:putrescine transport system substrate-binding protein